jgi:hypothetical protein
MELTSRARWAVAVGVALGVHGLGVSLLGALLVGPEHGAAAPARTPFVFLHGAAGGGPGKGASAPSPPTTAAVRARVLLPATSAPAALAASPSPPPSPTPAGPAAEAGMAAALPLGDAEGGGGGAGAGSGGPGTSGGEGDGDDASAGGGASLTTACWAEVGRQLAERARDDVPRALRERALLGQVVVTFLVGDGGAITQARVQQSSGRPLLDEAVLALLTRPLSTSCRGRGRWPVRWVQPRAPTP